MLKERLPVQIDPVRLARASRELEGSLRLAELPRLAAALASQEGEASVELQFGVDPNGVHFMQGRLRADLALICQRCMEPMQLPVDTEICLGVVANEKAAERLPPHYDPLLFTDEPLRLADLIEDELLLALPIVPKHAEGGCPAGAMERSEDDAADAPRSPFAVLSVLKGGKPGNDDNS